MTAAYYNYSRPELPWYTSAEEQQRFRKIKKWVIIIFLLLAVIIPFLPVPEVERDKVEVVPPRLAKLVLQRRQAPPPLPKVATGKKAKPEAKKKVKKKTPPKKDTAAARRKASRSGLLALQGDLLSLRDDSVVKSALTNQALSTSGAKARKSSRRSPGAADLTQGSGGISTAGLSRSTGGSGLAGRSVSRVESTIGNGSGSGGARRGGGGQRAGRSIEEIRLVFDRNKNAIYTIYNRVLRRDPTLQGKVVLELVISPSGRVTACRVVSSEINSPELTRKLVARVKLFNFGAKNVGQTRVNYPIEFFPS